MPLKKYTEFLPSERCSFCKLQETDVLYGPIYKCKQKFQQKCIVAHYYCLLMASKIEQNGRDSQGIFGFFPKDIIKELTRGNTLHCCYCNGLGATVHCIHKDCDKTFHLPCGIKKGTIHQFYDLFDSYCHSHRPKQNIPAAILRQVKDSCVICSIKIDKRNKYDSLWPTCCKPTVLIHRKCIQTMACNAGYYFKCPLCNNADIFKKEMQRIGIYIPEQDASWELEPNAYGELRVRGSGCESKECICPKGRGFTHKSSPWQLELCQVCGGNGVHLGCSKKWDKNLGFKLNWFCNICKPVYLENKASRTPEHPAANDEEPTNNSEESCTSTEDSSGDSESSIDVIGQSNDENLPKPSEPTEKSEPTKESKVQNNHNDEDDVIVVSEGEELPEPPPPLPPIKPTSVKENTSCEASSPNSDDEIEIVNIITSKRRNIEPVTTPRKRLRTAPWAPLQNNTGKGLLERIQQAYKGLKDSPPAVPITSSQIANPTITQNLYSNPIAGPSSASCTFEKPSFIPTSKENVADLLHQKNDTVKLQFDLMVQSGTKISQPNTKQRNSLSEQTEGTSLQSNIGIKLNEVSINRIVPEFPLNNETIDLSSDEECIPQPPIDTSIRQKGPSMVQVLNGDKFVDSKHCPSLSAQNINSFRNLQAKLKSKDFENWIDSQIIGKKIMNSRDKTIKQETSSPLIKKTNNNVPLQIILSSDEEEEPAGTAMKTSHSTRITNKPTITTNSNPASISNKTHFENRTKHPKIACNNNKQMFPIKKDTIQGVGMPVKRKETTELIEQKSNPVKRSTNLSMTSTSRSLSSDSVEEVPKTSILHNFLSSNRFSKDNSIKPDVLIVSDDDDDIKVENVSYGEKNLSSDTKMPKRNVKHESFPIEKLVEKGPEFKLQGSEGYGIITGVMSLSEDHFFSINSQLVDSEEGSSVLQTEINVEKTAYIETVPNEELHFENTTSIKANSLICSNIEQTSFVDMPKNIGSKIDNCQQPFCPSSNSLIQSTGSKLNIADPLVSSSMSEECASPVQSETKISDPSETLSLGTNACDVSSTTDTSFPVLSQENNLNPAP